MGNGELRVLHVLREASGGMVTHVSALVGALHRLDVTSAVAAPPGALQRLRERLHGAQGAGQPLFARLPLADGVRPATDLRAILWLRRLVRELRPDVVHAHGHKAAWAVSLAAPRPPARVVTVHNFLPARRMAWQAAAERTLARRALCRADAVIAVSETLRAFTEEILAGAAPGEAWSGKTGAVAAGPRGRGHHGTGGAPPVRVVRNALDPGWLVRMSPHRQAGEEREQARQAGHGETAFSAAPAGQVVVACVARLHDPKGVESLVEAACRLPTDLGVQVWIAGDGPQRPALETKARSLGLDGRVRWLGWADPTRVWAAAHIAVLPWLREGASYSALEAMAAGLPVVSFDCPGCREVLGEGAGLVVPEASAEALADALAGLARDPVRRREMGERARRIAAARTALEMGRETLDVYREAAARARRSGGRR